MHPKRDRHFEQIAFSIEQSKLKPIYCIPKPSIKNVYLVSPSEFYLKQGETTLKSNEWKLHAND